MAAHGTSHAITQSLKQGVQQCCKMDVLQVHRCHPTHPCALFSTVHGNQGHDNTMQCSQGIHGTAALAHACIHKKSNPKRTVSATAVDRGNLCTSAQATSHECVSGQAAAVSSNPSIPGTWEASALTTNNDTNATHATYIRCWQHSGRELLSARSALIIIMRLTLK